MPAKRPSRIRKQEAAERARLNLQIERLHRKAAELEKAIGEVETTVESSAGMSIEDLSAIAEGRMHPREMFRVPSGRGRIAYSKRYAVGHGKIDWGKRRKKGRKV